jgi:CHRD domain
MKDHRYKFFIFIIIVSVISVGSLSVLPNAARGQEQAFSAVLSGKNEVTPTNPNSAGLATFQTNSNASQISYSVNISGIEKANQVQIHIGTIGQNGDAVATLAEAKSASGNNDPPMILIEDNLTKDDLQGPLKDNQVIDLVNLMNNGTAYVNVYTDAYPDGEIRGQINFAEIAAGGGRSGSTKRTGDASGGASPGSVAPAPGIDPSEGPGDD